MATKKARQRATTNQEVADVVGVHFTTVSKYRNGTRVPSRDVCRRLAVEYQVPVADVMEAARSPRRFGEFMRSRIFASVTA